MGFCYHKQTTPREAIEKERDRCINIIPNGSDFKEWLHNREYPLDWMKKAFGENLIEKTTEEIYIGLKNDTIHLAGDFSDCDLCKRIAETDEKFLVIENSGVYDDYMGVVLCKDCIFELNVFMK